jgi:hypothetical protein
MLIVSDISREARVMSDTLSINQRKMGTRTAYQALYPLQRSGMSPSNNMTEYQAVPDGLQIRTAVWAVMLQLP